jgi:hypothetical protein
MLRCLLELRLELSSARFAVVGDLVDGLHERVRQGDPRPNPHGDQSSALTASNPGGVRLGMK